MNDKILFIISFLIFLSAIVCAILRFLKNHNIVHSLRIIGIALFLSDFIILLSLEPIARREIETTSGEITKEISDSEKVSMSILETFQIITLDISYPELIKAARSLGFSHALFFTILCILTPVICGGIVLTFFEKFENLFRYFFRFFQPIYFFSELNENSLELAKDIYKENKKQGLFVFCGVNSISDSELKDELKIYGFIYFRKAESEMILKPNNFRNYFELSEDQDANLVHTKALIYAYQNKYKNADFSKVKIYLFSEQKETSFVLSSIDRKGLPVIIVNRNSFIANDLFFNNPLYKALKEKQNTISYLQIGCGEIGTELVKQVLYLGQLGKTYKLKLTIIDTNAKSLESSLKLEMPEIFTSNYNISFIEADVKAESFKKALDSYCKDANYVSIVLGDDELNIHTALYLRSYYIRKNLKVGAYPLIAVRIKNAVKNEVVAQIYKEFTIFGGENLIYSKRLVNSELEKLAINIHQIYLESKKILDEKEILKDYYSKDEVYIKSNRANALHIRYKLFMLGYEICKLNNNDNSDIDFSISYEEAKKLAQIEHERWNAFMRTEGWCKLPLEYFTDKEKKINKIPEAKLHACICSWEELKDVDSVFNENYELYDENFVRYIPRILGLGNNTNISNVKYMLIKL